MKPQCCQFHALHLAHFIHRKWPVECRSNAAFHYVYTLDFAPLQAHDVCHTRWERKDFFRDKHLYIIDIGGHISEHSSAMFLRQDSTRGATVTGCTPVISFCCKGFYMYDKQDWNARKNTERLKFQDFNICPNILHVDADTDADGIAIALLH